MTSRQLLLSRAVVLLIVTLIVGSAAAQTSWTEVDQALGRSGQAIAGGVHKYGFPRTDLHVVLGDVHIEPALALGSWAAFKETGQTGEFLLMGDLVLLGPEVNPVIRALKAGGIDVTAVHNHLIGESPRLLYVHYEGMGPGANLARTLRRALETTKTPLTPGSPARAASAAENSVLQRFESALGRKGSMAGPVLQIGIPRADPIQAHGTDIPPPMGTAISINAQVAGEQVATTGDFVLAAEEVNGVVAALEAHGIDVEAIHTHMLDDKPRMFFLHFWALGGPARVGAGLKAALDGVQTAL